MIEEYNTNFDGPIEQKSESFDLDAERLIALDKESSGEPISKGMMIADIVDEHPNIVPIIMEYGVHCVGCGASSFETLEEGFMGHGMTDDEIDRIVDDLNEYIKKTSKKG